MLFRSYIHYFYCILCINPCEKFGAFTLQDAKKVDVSEQAKLLQPSVNNTLNDKDADGSSLLGDTRWYIELKKFVFYGCKLLFLVFLDVYSVDCSSH